MWPAGDDWIFLHSSRPLPPSEEISQHGKGFGILLDPQGVSAWHAAGESWLAVSSWIITAQLKLASVGWQQAGEA